MFFFYHGPHRPLPYYLETLPDVVNKLLSHHWHSCTHNGVVIIRACLMELAWQGTNQQAIYASQPNRLETLKCKLFTDNNQ